MAEKFGVVTMKGNPLTLVGQELKVGDMAPDAEVVGNDFKPVKLSSFRGKVCIISSVLSLETSVCDAETRRLNLELSRLGSDVVVLTISMDLPFTQSRWCGAAGMDKVKTLSDHKDAAFGSAYGVLVKELRTLARAVFVVDRGGVIRYIQLVKEIATEPNYDEVIAAVKKLL